MTDFQTNSSSRNRRPQSPLRAQLNGQTRLLVEPLEGRYLLSASLGHSQMQELVRSERIGSELIEIDFQQEGRFYTPTIVAGDPNGSPPSNPSTIVDPNVTSSALAGVVALNPVSGGSSGVCTGTLIDPTHIITAGHCVDFNDNGAADISLTQTSVIFNHSAVGATYTGISAVAVHPDYSGFNNPNINDDVAIITLNNPAPAAVPSYPISQAAWVSPELIVLAGYGDSGTATQGYTVGAGFDVKRTGRNVASGFGVDDEGSGAREIFAFDFDGPNGSGNTLNDGTTLGNNTEVQIGGGDSGGPSFLWNDANTNSTVDQNELTLFGINTYTGGGGNQAPFFGSQGGGMVVASYVDFIDDFVSLGGSGVAVVESNGDTLVSEDGTTDSYTLALQSNPTGSVTITATADAQSQLSLDGTNFTSAVSINLSDTTATTVVVRAIDDSDLEGSHTSTVTHQITATNDPANYPTSLNIDDVAAVVIDNDLAASTLVGVDFDLPSGSNPTNWTSLGQSGNTTLTDLIDETGTPTTIDLQVTETPNGSWDDFAAALNASTIPQHATSLANVDGQIFNGADTFNLTYSDLVPLAEYEIYVFAGEGFYSSISQQVTITGDGAPVSFSQNFNINDLFINDQVGSNSRSLQEYARIITADGSGEITIDVSALGGTQDVVLGGVAIAQVDAPPEFADIGESGTVSGVDDVWQTVNLTGTYANPVVVAGPPSYNGQDSSVVRIRNVTPNTFELRIDEWDYQNGIHTLSETVDYMVMEAGRFTLPDSTVVSAGVASVGTGFSTVFSGNAGGVVLTSVVSDNDSTAVTTRVRNVGSTFDVRLQEEEAADNIHANESVSWIQFGSNAGDINGLQYAAADGNLVTHDDFAVNFGSFASPPIFVAGMQTFNGADTAALRRKSLSATDAVVFVEEEKSANNEIGHVAENVGYVAMAAGVIQGEPVETMAGQIGETGLITLDDTWVSLNFSQSYVDPVVVLGSISFNGSQAATMRVRNLTSTGAEVQIQEWDYLDGTHILEDVAYMVMEAGVHTLSDGTTILAGNRSAVDHDFQSIAFASSFSGVPVVMSQVVTVNDGAAIATRQRNLTANGFDIRLQEEESADGVHGNETVAWIAIDQAAGMVEATNYEVAGTGNSVTHSDSTVTFSQSFATPPVFFAQMQTYNGADTANIRHRNLTTSSSDVFVHEEQSANSETNHTSEVVGYWAFDPGAISGTSAAPALAPQGRRPTTGEVSDFAVLRLPPPSISAADRLVIVDRMFASAEESAADLELPGHPAVDRLAACLFAADRISDSGDRPATWSEGNSLLDDEEWTLPFRIR